MSQRENDLALILGMTYAIAYSQWNNLTPMQQESMAMIENQINRLFYNEEVKG